MCCDIEWFLNFCPSLPSSFPFLLLVLRNILPFILSFFLLPIPLKVGERKLWWWIKGDSIPSLYNPWLGLRPSSAAKYLPFLTCAFKVLSYNVLPSNLRESKYYRKQNGSKLSNSLPSLPFCKEWLKYEQVRLFAKVN